MGADLLGAILGAGVVLGVIEPYVIDAADIVFFDPNGMPYAASCDRAQTINECIGAETPLGMFTQSPWGCEALAPGPSWAPPAGMGFALGVILMAMVVLHHWLDHA